MDVAPRTLYAEATGAGLPSWMEPDGERRPADPRRGFGGTGGTGSVICEVGEEPGTSEIG